MVTHQRANRQYSPIYDEDLWQFIQSSEKLYVAFTMEDGYPHVSPIWFCLIGRKLYLRTQNYKVKTRLAQSGKVCCTIDEGSKYKELRGVVIWGTSRTVTEKRLIDLVERNMRTKYKSQEWKSSEMPEWWVRERKAERRAYIEIVPLRISSWDNRRITKLPGRHVISPH